MSGPKVDTAELRRQEMNRLEQARQERKKLCGLIDNAIRKVRQQSAETTALMEQEGQNTAVLKNSLKQLAHFEKKLIRLQKSVRGGNELFDIQTAQQEMQAILHEIGADTVVRDATVLIQNSESLRRARERAASLKQTKRRILQSIAQNDPAGDVPPDTLKEQSETFEEEIRAQMQAGEMTGRHKNTILLISQELHTLLESNLPAQTKAKRLRRLYGEYETVNAHIHAEMETMRAVYSDYCSECFDSDTPPAALSDFSSMEELEEALQAVREKSACRVSQEYIRRQIDEVMAKHGYSIVRSDLLEESAAGGQVLYGVDDDTAINVFVSADNQVTMRVIGIGFDSDISEAEDERLYQQQCAFCSLHPQITAELAMRGVILHTRKHLAPNKKFNKKIQTRTRDSASSAASRIRKELKRQGLKTMHKNSPS